MRKIINKIKTYVTKPQYILLYLDRLGCIRLSDRKYIELSYEKIFSKKIDFENPKTFNEKLNWLKLYDRNPIYSKMVDKYEAKKYVAKIIGDKYIIPTIGIYDKFDDINFTKLPNQFVMKCTHDSGGLVICKDKSKLDIEAARKKINRSLSKNFYYQFREWPYKNVKPRIIIEKYMQNGNESVLKDYKFFCFNGEPKIMYLSEGMDNHSTAAMSFYDMDFNETTCKRKDYKLIDYRPTIPKNFDVMKELAKKLSKNIPHVRVDFYDINDHIYFGELTFYTNGGFIPFEEEKWDRKLGDMLELPKEKITDEK